MRLIQRTAMGKPLSVIFVMFSTSDIRIQNQRNFKTEQLYRSRAKYWTQRFYTRVWVQVRNVN